MGHCGAVLTCSLLFPLCVRWPGTRILEGTPGGQALCGTGLCPQAAGCTHAVPQRSSSPLRPHDFSLPPFHESKCPGAAAARPLVNCTCAPDLAPAAPPAGGSLRHRRLLRVSASRAPHAPPRDNLCSCSWVWACTLPLPWLPIRGCDVCPVASVCVTLTPGDPCPLQGLLLGCALKSRLLKDTGVCILSLTCGRAFGA